MLNGWTGQDYNFLFNDDDDDLGVNWWSFIVSYPYVSYHGRSETLYLFCPDKLLYCVDNMFRVIIFTAWWKFLPMRLDAFLYKLLFLCIIDFTANKNKNLSRLPQFIADIAHSSTNYKWIKIHNVSYINAWKSVIAVSKSNKKKKTSGR